MKQSKGTYDGVLADTHLTYSVDSENDVDDMDEDDVNNEEAKPLRFECSICFKGFDHKSACERHIKAQSDERPLKCEFPSCNKTFKWEKDLKILTRKHGDDYHCSLWYPGGQNRNIR